MAQTCAVRFHQKVMTPIFTHFPFHTHIYTVQYVRTYIEVYIHTHIHTMHTIHPLLHTYRRV